MAGNPNPNDLDVYDMWMVAIGTDRAVLARKGTGQSKAAGPVYQSAGPGLSQVAHVVIANAIQHSKPAMPAAPANAPAPRPARHLINAGSGQPSSSVPANGATASKASPGIANRATSTQAPTPKAASAAEKMKDFYTIYTTRLGFSQTRTDGSQVRLTSPNGESIVDINWISPKMTLINVLGEDSYTVSNYNFETSKFDSVIEKYSMVEEEVKLSIPERLGKGLSISSKMVGGAAICAAGTVVTDGAGTLAACAYGADVEASAFDELRGGSGRTLTNRAVTHALGEFVDEKAAQQIADNAEFAANIMFDAHTMGKVPDPALPEAPDAVQRPNQNQAIVQRSSTAPDPALPEAPDAAQRPNQNQAIVQGSSTDRVVQESTANMATRTGRRTTTLGKGSLFGVDDVTVVAHGNETLVEIGGQRLGPKEFAKVLVDSGFEGGTVRLASCKTGGCGAGGKTFAQELSKELSKLGADNAVIASANKIAIPPGIKGSGGLPTALTGSKPNLQGMPPGKGWEISVE
jgi:hypothetical protein